MANILRKGDRIESTLPPSTTRATTALPAIRSSKKTADPTFNPWDLSRIWIQCVEKEEATRKQWEQMYGWMAEMDAKGNPKPRQRPLTYSSRFSSTLPSSRGHDYGWHLETDFGREIKSLQTRFNNQHRRRRLTEVLGSD